MSDNRMNKHSIADYQRITSRFLQNLHILTMTAFHATSRPPGRTHTRPILKGFHHRAAFDYLHAAER
jgi:hypothetical protein